MQRLHEINDTSLVFIFFAKHSLGLDQLKRPTLSLPVYCPGAFRKLRKPLVHRTALTADTKEQTASAKDSCRQLVNGAYSFHYPRFIFSVLFLLACVLKTLEGVLATSSLVLIIEVP